MLYPPQLANFEDQDKNGSQCKIFGNSSMVNVNMFLNAT